MRRADPTFWTWLVIAFSAGCSAGPGAEPDGSPSSDPAVGPTTTDAAPVPSLIWQDCGGGFECAAAELPLDYARPRGETLSVAVTRLPARDRQRRIGSLFVNFGGPGGDAVASLHTFGAELFHSLNERFDIVGFDPRGTGQTDYAIDCGVNQETLGVYRQPFATPDNADPDELLRDAQAYVDACVARNSEILPFASTATAARDMDLLRAAVGDAKLSYLGFSYGTFLGATYASLFPEKHRALVLDGAVDPDAYINHPTDLLLSQTAGMERALDRFFYACALNQDACLGFGGADPRAAFDALVLSANAVPLPALGADPRPVTGEDILAGSLLLLYAKQNWPLLASGLAAASRGDGTPMRSLVDRFYGWLRDGGYDPLTDRYFSLGAIEQAYGSDPDELLQAGALSWGAFDHFWWNAGYFAELPLAIFPIEAKGVFRGPFRVQRTSPTALVVGTTYDPATPYRDAMRMVAELDNARLLTMQGDGHTAYGGNSECIDSAIEAYLTDGTLPSPGTVCQQDIPFAQPTQARALDEASAGLGDTAAEPLRSLARVWAARGR